MNPRAVAKQDRQSRNTIPAFTIEAIHISNDCTTRRRSRSRSSSRDRNTRQPVQDEEFIERQLESMNRRSKNTIPAFTIESIHLSDDGSLSWTQPKKGATRSRNRSRSRSRDRNTRQPVQDAEDESDEHREEPFWELHKEEEFIEQQLEAELIELGQLKDEFSNKFSVCSFISTEAVFNISCKKRKKETYDEWVPYAGDDVWLKSIEYADELWREKQKEEKIIQLQIRKEQKALEKLNERFLKEQKK